MHIIPKPQYIVTGSGNFTLTYHGRIVIDAACGSEILSHAALLNKDILAQLGYSLSITRGAYEAGCICLQEDKELDEEGYTLDIQPEGIHIRGGSTAGILYGLQTLRQIIAGEGAYLPCLTIRDYPDIKHRGYYLDVTRGRIPTLSYLKSFAEKLSYYKFNQLQLYVEHSFLFKELSEVWRDDTPLTAQEILELDAYCRELNIELVPSLSTFGHLYKLLSTKTYSGLCELPDLDRQVFSLDDRMQHHTIDVSNDQSLVLIKRLIDEYIPLFSSKHFNLCADETFDLGKGRSKQLAEELGVDTIYIAYVKELCDYLVQKGKRPMFWGDIIRGFPEAIRRLPAETICLNWGYGRDEREDGTRILDQAGATQYICPGVAGWNQFINLIDASYENITKMCSYAHKYKALGLLVTDWGDFGHINHPEFGFTGMVYAAAFSWNHEIIPREEMNRQISQTMFGDRSQTFVSKLAGLSGKSVFDWYHIVVFMELEGREKTEEEKREYLASIDFTHAKAVNESVREGIQSLYRDLTQLELTKRSLVLPYIVAAEGMALFNTVGATLQQYRCGVENAQAAVPGELAKQLEHWFHEYKRIWRTVSKESELYRLQNIILWYADQLRDL